MGDTGPLETSVRARFESLYALTLWSWERERGHRNNDKGPPSRRGTATAIRKTEGVGLRGHSAMRSTRHSLRQLFKPNP